MEFKNSFENEENLDLLGGILEELPGILNLVIPYIKDALEADKPYQPKCGLNLMLEMRQMSNIFQMYFEDHCKRDEAGKCYKDKLFYEYNEWAKSCGERQVKKRALTQMVNGAYPDFREGREHDGVRYWTGFKITKTLLAFNPYRTIDFDDKE